MTSDDERTKRPAGDGGRRWSQRSWAWILFGLCGVSVALFCFGTGWAESGKISGIANFGMLVMSAALGCLGVSRVLRPRVLELRDGEIRLLDGGGTAVGEVDIGAVTRASWSVVPGSDEIIPAFGTLSSIAKSGVFLRDENTGRVLSLRGFPVEEVVQALRERGVDAPLLALIHTSGDTDRIDLLFSEEGTIGSDDDADVVIHGPEIAGHHARWQLADDLNHVELVNLGEGWLKKGPWQADQGDSLQLRLNTKFELGPDDLEFQSLGSFGG